MRACAGDLRQPGRGVGAEDRPPGRAPGRTRRCRCVRARPSSAPSSSARSAHPRPAAGPRPPERTRRPGHGTPHRARSQNTAHAPASSADKEHPGSRLAAAGTRPHPTIPTVAPTPPLDSGSTPRTTPPSSRNTAPRPPSGDGTPRSRRRARSLTRPWRCPRARTSPPRPGSGTRTRIHPDRDHHPEPRARRPGAQQPRPPPAEQRPLPQPNRTHSPGSDVD